MTSKTQRYAFDPQDLDEIMDQIAERRLIAEGHLRSLHSDRKWLVARDEAGQRRQIELP